jgi:hypothetical protein
MIDYFAIALTHALIVMAALRLLSRADLDQDPAPGEADPAVNTAKDAIKRPGIKRPGIKQGVSWRA